LGGGGDVTVRYCRGPGHAAGNTDDWMIGFAPANNPKIAVAVVLPLQPFAGTGAAYAGPIMKAMLDAAALLPSG